MKQMKKEEIIENLREFTHYHGIAFLKESDAEEYYKDLVELIEALIEKNGRN